MRSCWLNSSLVKCHLNGLMTVLTFNPNYLYPLNFLSSWTLIIYDTYLLLHLKQEALAGKNQPFLLINLALFSWRLKMCQLGILNLEGDNCFLFVFPHSVIGQDPKIYHFFLENQYGYQLFFFSLSWMYLCDLL